MEERLLEVPPIINLLPETHDSFSVSFRLLIDKGTLGWQIEAMKSNALYLQQDHGILFEEKQAGFFFFFVSWVVMIGTQPLGCAEEDTDDVVGLCHFWI